MTSATINATFEEHIVIEFVQTDFTALKETSPYKVYMPSALNRGEYREVYKFKDLSDLGIHDIDDLQRSKKFFHKKVNGSLELK
ncbi:hypothetical protein [Bacillus wiedmannii]|nr:hypothetical protein [Bacillus wiedmannii]PEJ48446.1 hypothetical protein CN672_13975 [Bacillus wiedmannii]PEM10268.1 hypothetical protein CN610_13855 [Bacillus wiedmannii]PGD08280.1 hypothetical protein COM34_14360 [Bacillus wiedmannii]PHD09548.1 hypothetical protein COF45_17795 [Bacillus wiedmannii]